MNYKKSALILSLVATPAIVTFVEETPASANTYYDSQVEAVINLINQINPNYSTYTYYLTEAYNAFYKLTTTQQAYVYNSSTLFNYLSIYNSNNNNNTTTNQTIINTFSTKVYAISLGTTTFLRDLQEANRYYNSLTAAQKMFIPHYLYSQLLTYNENLAKVRAVETSFNNLNILDPYYTTTYLNTLQSYNALPYNYRYLIETVAKAKADEYTLYHSLDNNRAVAQKVTTAISNLTTSSKVTDVENTRKMYEGLTALQKTFVSNLADLRYIEDVQKNVQNGWDPDFYDEEADIYTEITVEDYGDMYYIYMPYSEMKAGQTTIKVNDRITLKIPRSAIPVTSKNKNAVITMTIEEVEGESYIFTADLYEEPLEFASYIDIEIKKLPATNVILKADYTGNYIATPFSYRLSKHIIRTKTSGAYIVSNEKATFYDIQNDPSRSEIELLAKRKIVSGVRPNYFEPKSSVTIAQYASMISRAMDIRSYNESSYRDVQGQWFEEAIQALLENGILTEKQSTNFRPNEIVTRKQAAIISIRMLEYAGIITGNPDYASVPFKDFHLLTEDEKLYVATAYEYGIFGGKSDGRFDPDAKLTRSQMAKVLHRTLQIARMM